MGTLKDNQLTIFKSTLFEDDEDRALTKNDGTPTYFANDIAYHFDKIQRGSNHLIDILGADHDRHLIYLLSDLNLFGFCQNDMQYHLQNKLECHHF